MSLAIRGPGSVFSLVPWRSKGSSLAELVPGITTVVLAVLVLLPIGFVLFTSAQSAAPGAPGSVFSLSHWSELASDRSRLAILNTLRIALMVAVFSVGIGLL